MPKETAADEGAGDMYGESVREVVHRNDTRHFRRLVDVRYRPFTNQTRSTILTDSTRKKLQEALSRLQEEDQQSKYLIDKEDNFNYIIGFSPLSDEVKAQIEKFNSMMRGEQPCTPPLQQTPQGSRKRFQEYISRLTEEEVQQSLNDLYRLFSDEMIIPVSDRKTAQIEEVHSQMREDDVSSMSAFFQQFNDPSTRQRDERSVSPSDRFRLRPTTPQTRIGPLTDTAETRLQGPLSALRASEQSTSPPQKKRKKIDKSSR